MPRSRYQCKLGGHVKFNSIPSFPLRIQPCSGLSCFIRMFYSHAAIAAAVILSTVVGAQNSSSLPIVDLGYELIQAANFNVRPNRC